MQEITISEIRSKIINLPGRPPFMLDRALAEIYQVETGHLNRASNRNPDRFPDDFRFQLTSDEVEILRCQNVISSLNGHGGLRYLPYVYTREGCNMMSACLETPVAVKRSVFIMRAFSAMEREALKEQADSEPADFITGEKFDLSVRRFKTALEAAKLSGISNEHEARLTANRITKKTTGLDLLEFVRPGYTKSASESSHHQPLISQPEEHDENLILFINAWWEKYGDNSVDSAHLSEVITNSDISLNLGKGNDKSRKIRLGKILSNLNGQQVGSYIITDAGKHRNIRLWKLRPVEKSVIDS